MRKPFEDFSHRNETETIGSCGAEDSAHNHNCDTEKLER